MIGFFRKIRRKLADDNKPMKYMRYAVGEILLVMIGILLALQVNNWNEQRKDAVLEKEYLKGIRDDLKQDIDQATIIINSKITQLNIIHILEPHFNFISTYKLQNIDTTSRRFRSLFGRGKSFRSTSATYNSLIADGKTNLIINKKMFQKLQSIYEEQYPRIFSIYEVFKNLENGLQLKYSYEKYHWNYKTLMKKGNERMIADLANFWDTGYDYCGFLDETILDMKSVIKEIDIELEK